MKQALAVVCAAFVAVSAAHAEDTARFAITGPAASYHFNRTVNWNEFNAGAGVRVETSPRHAFTLSAHENSYRDTSIYAAWTFTPLTFFEDRVKLGGMGALASGYGKHCVSVQVAGACVLGALAAEIQPWRSGLGVTLLVLPARDGAVVLQTHWRF